MHEHETDAPESTHGHSLGSSFAVNETAELVLDLLARSELVAATCSRSCVDVPSKAFSVTQALIDQDVAASDGVARMLAARHHLPLVDLPNVGVAADAAQHSPLAPTAANTRIGGLMVTVTGGLSGS